MANYPPPYPPPGPPYGNDWKYQRRMMKEQARAQRDMLRAQQQAYRYQMRSMRRGSILGPLMVVGIGIVFLLVQTGHIAGRDLWMWYGRWWPALLVGAGLVMLLEWGFDQFFHSDQPQLRRRSVGGGVFTLLLLFGLVGIFFSGMREGHNFFGHGFNINQDNLDEFMGDKHESNQSLSHDFPSGSSLSVDNPRGDVTISGTSADNQIHITANKQVFTRSDSDADNKAQQLSPKVDTNGNKISVTVPSIGGGRADLDITIPAAANTTVAANHGDIHVTAIKAPVTVTANHGDIVLSAITGTVGAHINNGDSSFSARSVTGPVTIEGRGRDLTISEITGPVSMSGDFYGTTHVEHVRGPVRFHSSRMDLQLARLDGEIEFNHSDISADQAVGPFTLTTSNKNITLDRITGDISVTNRNGSVDLTSAPPLGNVTVENRNGSVNVTVPEQAGFTVQAEATNGDVENDFSLATEGNDNRKNFGGTIGKGGSLIRITTSQGDVALKKASIAPLPPAPPPPLPLSIRDADGSSVIIGKDGVSITSSPDGSSVIVGKNGIRIATKADGSSSYVGKDGTKLTTGSDGTKVYVGKDGTNYTSRPDGSKTYMGKDGTRITISADGTSVGIGSNGKPLSADEIRNRIRQAEDEIRKTTEQREAQQRKEHSAARQDN
jgi:DUF4097 and DUF4098 domain-containing protein YvlB